MEKQRKLPLDEERKLGFVRVCGTAKAIAGYNFFLLLPSAASFLSSLGLSSPSTVSASDRCPDAFPVEKAYKL